MVTFPNAKINIGLFVTEKRKDNYHTIESVFYPVKFNDILEAGFYDPAFSLLQVSGIEIEGKTENNLVLKAVDLIKNHLKKQGDDNSIKKLHQLRFFLHKIIPTGAGLGGGSADGTFALKSVIELLHLTISEEELTEMAAQLGSDCPFFIRNTPAFVTGRGEIIKPVDLNLSGLKLVLILPGIHISTAEAYSNIVPVKSKSDLTEIAKIPLKDWKKHLQNDFEKSVFNIHPVIGKIKKSLYDCGAVYAQMSGSGSAVYGIFEAKNFSENRISSNEISLFRKYYIDL